MSNVIIITTLAVSLFLLLLPTLNAQMTCPPRCRSCANQEAICSRRSLTAPPKVYPDGIRIINLEGNHIRVIGARSFNTLSSVEVLKMNGNKIVALRYDAFRAFPNLQTLDLSGNRISRIHRRALRRIPLLRSLSLNRNRIRSISGIFNHVSNLFQLNLASNHIQVIGQRDFAALTQVHNLDLRENRITTIHGRAFEKLDYLRYLFLNNNPIVRLPTLNFGSEVLQLVDLSHCQLNAVPGPFPASVADLRLGNNRIMQINHTDLINITDLQMLALNDNELHFLADGTLTHMQELQEVWLRANNLVYIPRNLPNNIRKLYMDFNNIQMIETGLFSNQSYLEYLTVENNQIHIIQPNTFTGLRNLNTLNFRGNQIVTLERDTFRDLGSLATLMLSNNPMETIEAGAFHNLGNLTQLFLNYIIAEDFDLQGNFLPAMLRLRSLNLMNSPGLVDDLMAMVNDPAITNVPLQDLTMLDLSYNTLEWVSPRVRDVFPSLQSIPLDGNPLRCSRNLKWLRDWMVSSDVTFHNHEEVVCESPYRLRGRQLTSLRDDEWAREDEVDIGGAGFLTEGQGGGTAAVRGSRGGAALRASDDLRAVAPSTSYAARGPSERRNKRKRSKEGRRARKGKGRKGKKRNRKDRDGKRRRNKDKGKRRRKREAYTEEEAQQMGMAL